MHSWMERLLDWKGWGPSAIVLIASNLLTIFIAIYLGLDPAEVLWVYWLESVIIGAFTAFTFISMALRSLLHVDLTGSLAAAGSAAFFSVHYGIFHAVYAVFLRAMPWFIPAEVDYFGVAIAVGVLTLSHGYSFAANILLKPSELENTKENRKRIMGAPYARIIPMHLTIIFSGFIMMPLFPLLLLAGDSLLGWLSKFVVLLLFMSLKTAADLVGHISRYRRPI
ncbi:MAG: DUF6498-containing protein [Candidatus Micrarchaeota archaeon]